MELIIELKKFMQLYKSRGFKDIQQFDYILE